MRYPVILGVLAVANLVLPRAASPQSGTAATPPAGAASPAKPTAKRVPVSKAVFGDAAVIVNARDDGFIEVAAAGPGKTVLLQLRTMAARAWMDSTARMLRARIRKSDTPRSLRAEVDEYGTNSTMAVTRSVTGSESQYALFFTDTPTGGVTVPIEASEADVFVAIVRKAVAQAVKMLDKPDTTARADSVPPVTKKKAAAKRASPPKPASTKTDSAAAKPATTAPVKPPVTAPVKPSTPPPVKPR